MFKKLVFTPFINYSILCHSIEIYSRSRKIDICISPEPRNTDNNSDTKIIFFESLSRPYVKICYNIRKSFFLYGAKTIMRKSSCVILIFILFSVSVITSCGSKENTVSATVSANEEPQQEDILVESQQTRQELANSIATANSILGTVSDDGVPKDSTDIIRHSSGEAPSSYKPRGQMVTEKYRSYRNHSVITVNPTPDTITKKEPSAVITSNPQAPHTSSSSSSSESPSDQSQPSTSSSSKAPEPITVPIADSGGLTIALPSDTMVWLSETGEKFHNQNKCGNMNPENATHVTLYEAKSKIPGIEACKKCYGE